MRAPAAEHGPEPVHGLPWHLPEGERILWQGAPATWPFARHALHLGWLAAYFGVLTLGAVLHTASGGVAHAASAALIPLGLAAGAGALVLIYSWLTHRTTVYTVTNRRVAIRFGVALSKTFNLPFTAIEGAQLRLHADGSGDLPLGLGQGARIGWLLLWPHVRPWKLANAQPMLRAVPDAARAAQVLGRALAASADMPAPAAPAAPSGAAPSATGVAAGPALA
jgi:hypothetical protein